MIKLLSRCNYYHRQWPVQTHMKVKVSEVREEEEREREKKKK
jgi:hypothetical protein